MSGEPRTEADAVADLAEAAVEPSIIDPDDSLLSVIVPQGAEHKLIDLEQFKPAPDRKRGSVMLHDANSLVAYTAAHEEGAHTAIYADVESATIVAVLNGHGQHQLRSDGAPNRTRSASTGWGDHWAQVRLRQTDNWKHWSGKDTRWLRQTEFAEHIEEGLIDIVDPAAALMLEMAQTFQANSRVAFKSSTMLTSGQRQLVYEETVEAKAGQKGTIAVPTSFTLGVAVFEGQTEGHRVSARLQFRINGGDLTMRYLLDRPRDVVRAAFDAIVGDVEVGTGILAYRGSAPSID